METSSEFAVRIFLWKANLRKGYKRNEAQGSNSAVFINDVYTIFYRKKRLVQKLPPTKKLLVLYKDRHTEIWGKKSCPDSLGS